MELARVEQDTLLASTEQTAAAPPGVTHTKAKQVDSGLTERALDWAQWQSDGHENGTKFETRYTFGFFEQMLILSGQAVITPQTSSDAAFAVNAGDLICFGRGLRCMWDVEQPIVARYVYLDEEGQELHQEGLNCDKCEKECWDRSWLVAEEDLCIECYEQDPIEGAVYQEQGQPAEQRTGEVAAETAGTKREAEAEDTIKPHKKQKVDKATRPKVEKAAKQKAESKPKVEKAVKPEPKPKVEKAAKSSVQSAEESFEIGAKVWAKLPGWPAWPAKVTQPV